MRDNPRPLPFLKWAGGKRQLVDRILAAAPPAMDTYYEPFLGGGAVFFALAAAQRFKRAHLADVNGELIHCYQVIQRDVSALIRELKKYPHDRAFYYRLRDRDPQTLAPVERAARLVYLNRCGYNGLYRVNSSGRFNVPFGRYRNPVICDEAKLRAASSALQNAELVCRDFAGHLKAASSRDFVYLDPPYVPLSRTSSFTAYAQARFGAEEQERLAAVLRDLAARGVPALLSNSDCATTRRLYHGLPKTRVPVRRAINNVASGRGPVPEILVRSFAYQTCPTGGDA
jgi:DNA adenine methylase